MTASVGGGDEMLLLLLHNCHWWHVMLSLSVPPGIPMLAIQVVMTVELLSTPVPETA
jgi:hypothetical protein